MIESGLRTILTLFFISMLWACVVTPISNILRKTDWMFYTEVWFYECQPNITSRNSKCAEEESGLS